MRKVSKDDFYAIIYRENLNVHPSPQRHHTEWKFPDGRVFGVTRPGYLLNGSESYEVAE